MDPTSGAIFVTLGALFFVGLVADLIGRRTPVPRVALLISAGFVIGPGGMDLIPVFGTAWFPFVTDLALVMVGFLVGGSLERSVLAEHGRSLVISSITITVATFIVVLLGALALGVSLAVSLLLAAVATATDPAAVTDTVREARARGPFTTTIRGIVALDDAWGLIAFTIALASVKLLNGDGGVVDAVARGSYELLGAVALGALVGVPVAFLTGRVKSGEPTQAEALGAVLLCGGLALSLHVSYLLSAMVMGAVVANLAKHHRRPFNAIEELEWPFLIVFFLLAGASFEFGTIRNAGLLLLAYLVLRVAGRMLGGLLCIPLAGLRAVHGRWLGPALLPQAGVAMGMTLVASRQVPEVGALVLPIVLAGTIIFEVVGPVVTRMGLSRVGETPDGYEKASRP